MLSIEILETRSLLSISSVRDGLWSDPATWNGGKVPTATDDVIVANNVTIDHAVAREVDINAGTTTLAGDLQAYGSVVVRSKLTGSAGGIFFHVANDQLFAGNTKAGPDATQPDFHPEDTGLWALRGSTVNLQGDAVSSWLDATATGASQDLGHGVTQRVSFTGTQATLASAPAGWKVGDTLLLVNEHGQSVLADLVSVSGTSIQYHQHKAQATDPDLVGHSLVTVGSNLVVNSKVANLSRRIQIVGADVHQGDFNHRAQTSFLDGSTVNLTNVELRDLGARGKLGRYPVYFDGGGAITSSLTGSSIWQDVSDPGNRFVALKSVRGVTISNNVAYRGQGDGFFLENTADYGNSITGNLSVQVTGSEELPDFTDATDETHHFWLRAGNTISNNVAAGGDAIGLIVLPSAGPGAGLVTNMQAFGTGLFGMWTATPNVTFANPISVYNERAGFASDPSWDVDSSAAALNNPLLLLNGTNDSSYGSQIYMNNSPLISVNGGVLAGNKAFHTHYHSAFTITNARIDVGTLLVPTYWEQAVTMDHDTIKASLLFERSYPSPRYVSPGLVRITNTNLTEGNDPPEVENADYIGDIFQNYPGFEGEAIPNAIELDHLAAPSGFIRVTMLSDADRWMTNIARWTVTPIGQTPKANTFIYQRQTQWSQLSSVNGYPDGFPPGQYAVSLYDDNGTLLKSGFADVRSGQVSDLTATLPNASGVVGRSIFYNQSKYDGNSAATNVSDDQAIASDKSAYLPGSAPATFANITSYSQGINGVMVDLAGTGSHGAITASDFVFKVGTGNQPGTWASAPAPVSVVVRPGAGVGGSDRVELVWANGAIRNEWLQVQVLTNPHTGLSAPDVFYFGNLVGDSGQGDSAAQATTNATDEIAVRNHPAGVRPGIPVSNLYDYNRDGQVNSTDQLIARNAGAAPNHTLQFVTIAAGAGSSAAPAAEIAFALTASAATSSNSSLPQLEPPSTRRAADAATNSNIASLVDQAHATTSGDDDSQPSDEIAKEELEEQLLALLVANELQSTN